jgi:mono/diheme cytochrome c family protein
MRAPAAISFAYLRSRRRCAAALYLLIACSACKGEPAPKREWTPADHGQPAAPDDENIPEQPSALAPGEDPEARAARALWNATCAGCHGRDGRGQGESRPPVARIPDFTAAEWQESRSDAALSQTIADGRGMMPPFGKQINPQGVAALVRHIRRFAPSAQATPEGATGQAPAQPSAPPPAEP